MYISKPVPSTLSGLTDFSTRIPYSYRTEGQSNCIPVVHPCLPDLRERIRAFFWQVSRVHTFAIDACICHEHVN
jgi:hypothetical protein